MEQRPDGAATQEVYNMVKNVFNHQTSSKELAAWPDPAAFREDEDKCLVKGPNRAQDLHHFRPLKLQILLANSEHMIVSFSIISALCMF